MRIEYREELSSTNEYIKNFLGGGEDVIVCARRQTGGKGTKGRTFLSQEGGVYLSALTFYENFPARDAFRIMSHAAVAVCRAAERFGAVPEIKWANDVLLFGRKLCGILIENELEGPRIRWSIVGIGVNVSNDVSALGGIAATLSEVSPVSAEEFRDALVEELAKPADFSEYLGRVRFLGREVGVAEGERSYRAVARRILPDGRLELEAEGRLRTVTSAEISLLI